MLYTLSGVPARGIREISDAEEHRRIRSDIRRRRARALARHHQGSALRAQRPLSRHAEGTPAGAQLSRGAGGYARRRGAGRPVLRPPRAGRVRCPRGAHRRRHRRAGGHRDRQGEALPRRAGRNRTPQGDRERFARKRAEPGSAGGRTHGRACRRECQAGGRGGTARTGRRALPAPGRRRQGLRALHAGPDRHRHQLESRRPAHQGISRHRDRRPKLREFLHGGGPRRRHAGPCARNGEARGQVRGRRVARPQGRVAILGQRHHQSHPRQGRPPARFCQDHPRHHGTAGGADGAAARARATGCNRRRWRASASSREASRTISTTS